MMQSFLTLYISFIPMKKLVLSVILLLIPILYSCDTDRKAKFVIGVSQCSDDLWRQTMNKEMLQEASFYQGMEVEIKTVKDDTRQQIKDIEYFIDRKVDLLVVSPNESKAVTPIVQKAYRAGIPVILVDRKIDTDDYTAFVGADNYQIGREAAHYIASVLNGRGNVVEIRGWNGSTSDADRHNGFMAGIKNFPDIRIVAERRGNFLKNEAEQQMGAILKDGIQADLVFALNDPMALGVHDALIKYSGRLPFIIGIDALSGEGGGIQNIQNGIQDASFIYPTGGDKVIDLAYSILNNEKYEKENILYTAVVDKSNVRVIKLQTDKIFEHQAKIDKMNLLLDHSLTQYSNQRTLFSVSIFALVLISFSLLGIYFAYRAKSRANVKLGKSNQEIKAQAETLAMQKEQLIALSKELEEATQAKLVFFTNISHELKTPLTLILGPVESLLASAGLTADQKELLGLIRRNSEQLSRLISQIIEFRSYENGKMKGYFSKDDLKAYLCDLSYPFYDFAQRRNSKFEFMAEDSDFRMYFDKEKMEKIYGNLLSNAFRYTEKDGGRIEVRLSRTSVKEKDCAKIEVFNTGKAIPEEQVKNIFKRFYKVNPHDVGSGIGLALTNALVETHRGTIGVESKDGKGTTFSVIIPFDQILNEADIDSTDYCPILNPENILENNTDPVYDVGDIDPNKASILVVEDNADVRTYIRKILGNDYLVIESADGGDGIAKAMEYSPDIIISDIMMPDKDGFEVCRTLKENLSTSHIPIILLTACALDEQRAAGFESGADAYIPKPFNAELLKIRIRKLIENRRKIKEAFNSGFASDTKKILLEKQEQEFIDKLEDYVKEHVSDPNLNVDIIAMHMGLSKSQLYRKVKSLTDYAPNEMIRIIRLKYAKKLLTTSSKSVSEIAYDSGFSSPSYFTKCFKEFYDESPTDYIDKLE